ncbi:replicative DNA helicase [Desulfobaculum bizertense]|uniref:Replicative DNA helicase n=1 Tax=Desulfobaculum bizertense DSM 18034 TaxID=1121442 RepID=A0A1T4W6R9_9BACT|nr:replicative DNA helicase [Desulfobaculum bizertense]SKA72963.1 replicative DNA helicase [Desulfobaculum bizertense DSM 18034]
MTQDRSAKLNRPKTHSSSRSSEEGTGGFAVARSLERASGDVLRKVPPHNLEAEQAVLGGVFLKPNVFHDLVDLLGEDDFYSPAHRIIFRAFQECFRKSIPMDLVTVAEELRSMGLLDDVGGPVYLAELAASTVSASNALFHAQIVRNRAVQRQLIGVASGIIESCFDERSDVEGLLDESEQQIFAISEQRSNKSFVASKELVNQVFQKLQELYSRKEVVTGVPTGYYKFDEITAGLQPTDLIIIAGRPAMGKTSFALNLGLRAASDYGTPSAVFSLEMGMDQLMMRMLCTKARVNLSDMRRGFIDDEAWARLYDAAEDMSSSPIFIDDTPSISTLELRARCRRLKAEKGLGLVIVDYLQLMRAGRNIDSREQEISEISRSLKALAKELKVPVIALSQLNRKVEERTDKRPKLSDLRESGAIEQDADMIVFLYRDEVYNKSEDNPKKGIAEIIIGKHRNGPTGAVELMFQKEYTAFENLTQQVEPSEYAGSS